MKTGDRLSVRGIEESLKGAAAPIHVFGTVGSTNDAARELAEKGAAHGTAVLAEEQANGRGRCGRSFYSPAGRGIYMSIVLRPEPGRALSLFTVAAAVAVTRAIEDVTGRSALIKWPNDVLVDGRKVCGILAEAAGAPADRFVVLGAGINFCARAEDFPPECKETAGALYERWPSDVSRDRLAAAVIDGVLAAATAPENALEEYRARSVVLGRLVALALPRETVRGKAVGIDEGGALVVEDGERNRRAYAAGEVRIMGWGDGL